MRTKSVTIPPLPPVSEPQVLVSMDLKVVTPMFGGAVYPGRVDEEQPVRACTVRGHLRWWWRALYGHQAQTAEELWEEETRLWGGLGRPSRLMVQVQTLDRGKPWSIDQVRKGRWRSLAYLLFPFLPNRREGKAGVDGRTDVRFRLTIALRPGTQLDGEQKKQVERTVAVWSQLGGVGARTRRGCGALWVERATVGIEGTTPKERMQWLAAQLRSPAPQAPRPLLPPPSLRGATVRFCDQAEPMMDAWNRCAQIWKDFRTAKDCGWPDGAAVQRLLGGHREAKDVYLPKADLGLPIVFHHPQKGWTATLAPAETGTKSRMASPILLRPVVLDGCRAFAATVVLRAPSWGDPGMPSHLLLQQPSLPAEAIRLPATCAITPQHLPTNSLLARAGGSARQAFLLYAKEHQLKEMQL
jgi:CRISPR-associated protein Cmr1